MDLNTLNNSNNCQNNNIISEYKFDIDFKPNLNYWATSPVMVKNVDTITNSENNKPFQIIPNDIILNKMENIIQIHPYKLDYKVNDPNLDSNKLCEFINANYIETSDSEHKFLYPTDLLEYYISKSLVLSFYSKQTESKKSQMIGLIIGKKAKLYIDKIEFDTIETNFLILNPKVRNNNLAPLMISILTKESILNYSIGISHYTINNPIKAPHYSLKYYYHRMINIPKLFDTKFISSDITTINDYVQIYNNFKDYLPNQMVIYFNKKNIKNKVSDELVDLIYQNINLYVKNKYVIYEYRTREQIKQIFGSESFHNFILVESNNEKNKYQIKNYICLNEIKTLNINNNKAYSNGYIYTGFYSDNVDIVIEKISQYIYLNNILDVITWSDFFDVDNSCTIAIKGSGFLKYYLYNIQTFPIPNESNGLVTL
jgi:hypothetical protein